MKKNSNSSSPGGRNGILMLIIATLLICSCKKQTDDKAIIPENRKLSGRAVSIENLRNANPYSISVVRLVKNWMVNAPDQKTILEGRKPLKTNRMQLYCQILPKSAADITNISKWLESDTLHQIVPYPIDSVSLYPSIFTEDVINGYSENPQTFYTTIKAGDILPGGVPIRIIDTLYIPDSDEGWLDFTSNWLTGNLSNDYIESIGATHPEWHEAINNSYANGQIVTMGGNYNPNFNNPPLYPVPAETGANDDRYYMSDPVVNPPNGRVTFKEPVRNVMEGVKNVKVQFVRFTFFGISYASARTDEYGIYNLNAFSNYGGGIATVTFADDYTKIKAFNTNNVGNVIGGILNAPFAATYVKTIGFWTNANAVNFDFEYNTKEGLWSMIKNAIYEANQYTVDLGMRSSVNQSKHLNVVAYYRSNRGSAGAGSTPMFSYVGTSAAGVSWIFDVIDQTVPSPLNVSQNTEILDMIIQQAQNNPYAANDLRQTIYHEYGHSLHYFKVGQAFWQNNISKTLSAGDGYGSAINADPGNFLALTEGWADYIGNLYAYRKYGTQVSATEWCPSVSSSTVMTGNYNVLLEGNPTYYNAFIPRGLFYDLTDTYNAAEPWDNIQGYTTNNIYQVLNVQVNTIQLFRSFWNTAHPSSNNALLFNNYNVN